MTGETAPDRTILKVSGSEARDFLQGLVTNDVAKLDSGLVYTALLTPQGKLIADFFLVPDGDAVLLDVHESRAETLRQRLGLYKLRADVEIADVSINVLRGLGPVPEGAFADPRHSALGWRRYSTDEGVAPEVDWDAIRVAHLIPETDTELSEDTFILEAGFDALHGVDFRKGCYVGQEVTARMKHKTALRKGYARVNVAGEASPGTPIETEDGKPAGTLHTRAGDTAIAYLRFDRANGPMQAGAATVTRVT